MSSLIAIVIGVFLSHAASPVGEARQAAADPARLAPAAFVAAARRGDENAVRKALALDPALATATDAAGLTALDWAATRDDWPVFRQLLAAGAPVDRVGFDGGTVLHRAAHHDRPEMIRALLDAGADVGASNQWGRTPLHVAARRGCVRSARLLIERGAALEAETREGWTPLNVAYRSGQPEIVTLLLAAGADPDHRDAAGKRPSDVAFERPAEIAIEPDRLFEYQGLFKVSDTFAFKVWVEDGRLRLEDFAAVDLYPTGPDAFYSTSEPWAVSFSRDAEGRVATMAVRFLRRTEEGVKVAAPEYVGSARCGECHRSGEGGAPYVSWLQSRHGLAYWRLATDWARVLASTRPHFQDLTAPQQDARCLLCHRTGAQDERAIFAKTFHVGEGIGCEACHGPGSLYANAETMGEREAFLAAGGRIPDARTCETCHRDPARFAFATWWPKIAHGRTTKRPL